MAKKSDIWLSYHAQRDRFVSSHWLHHEVGKNLHKIEISGVALIDMRGESTKKWTRKKIHLYNLPIPGKPKPKGKQLFKMKYWVPFATINSIYNKEHSVDGGYAVDSFSMPNVKGNTQFFELDINVAVRDSDAYLLRIGYHISAVGSFFNYTE